MKKIFIGPSSFCQNSDEPINILNKHNFEVVLNPLGRKLNEEELIKLLDKNFIGSIAGLEKYNEKTLLNSDLKVISRVGSGLDNINFDYTSRKNIKIFSTPDGPVNSVAELTISMIINLVRNIFPNVNSMSQGVWERFSGKEINNKNIVIIGYGRIGKKVTKILSSFCKNIYIVDPFVKSSSYNNISYEESLAIGDIFSIHTNSKECYFDINSLKKTKKKIYIFNASRGHNLNDQAILYGIKEKIINSVWIDVFDQEPYTKGVLFGHDKIIMTPHIASYTAECRKKMELDAVLNLVNYLNENKF